MATATGETVFVSPFTGERFTSQFAFNDHMARWPAIAKANGLSADGSPRPESKAEPKAESKVEPKTRGRKSTPK